MRLQRNLVQMKSAARSYSRNDIESLLIRHKQSLLCEINISNVFYDLLMNFSEQYWRVRLLLP